VLAALLPAAPAAADSLRIETLAEHGVAAARVVYVGDERDNSVGIGLATNADISQGAPSPGKVIGFRITGDPARGELASAVPGCEPGLFGVQVCRVPAGTRSLAPRVYARGGRDTISVTVPRRGAIVYGGPGNDVLESCSDCGRKAPSELHGGAGRDYLQAAACWTADLAMTARSGRGCRVGSWAGPETTRS
jgi:hypothetical protein